jgi:hypothetical protein
MNLLVEEEKKDAAEAPVPGGIDERGDEKDSKSEDDDDDEEELVDLPQEVAEGIARVASKFESEEALEEALVIAGFGDLPVVLVDRKPRLIMPSDQHNDFTTTYLMDFEKRWAKDRWGFCSATHKIHLPNGRSRDLDLSYWGYPRCTRDPMGNLVPADGSVPDVIIQFSWKNPQNYEADAINDMMNRALEEDHGALSTTRPTLGYLIKVKFSKKRTLQAAIKGSTTQDMDGLDIYRLPHGTTLTDALNPNNLNASHYYYEPGGPEHLITITPGNLGITGVWALVCGEYRIKASLAFEKMKKFHQSRQKKGLAT